MSFISEETREKLRKAHRRYDDEPVTLLKRELWKDIEGWPGWQVSSKGRISENGMLRKPYPKDPRRIFLRIGARGEQFSILQLVLLAFVGPPPPGKPLARHLDDNPANNCLANAACESKSDNYDDAFRNGKIDLSLERALKISNSKKGKWIGGRANNKGRFVITNGIEERRVFSESEIPEEWRKGRSDKFSQLAKTILQNARDARRK